MQINEMNKWCVSFSYSTCYLKMLELWRLDIKMRGNVLVHCPQCVTAEAESIKHNFKVSLTQKYADKRIDGIE